MNWSSKDMKDKFVDVMDTLRKYKIYVISAVIIFIFLLIIIISLKSNNNLLVDGYIELIGPKEVRVYKDENYEELGYKIFDNKKNEYRNDIEVEVESNLNINKVGKYKITYKAANLKATRNVYVIAKPEEYYKIILEENEEDKTIYLKLNDKYLEPGYTVIDQDGNDITDTALVKIDNQVDINTPGEYVVIYEVTMPSGETSVVKRDVIVIANDIEITLDKEEYTNSSVILNIKAFDDYFDYIELPDGTKIEEDSYAYEVIENGTYSVKLYNKKGFNIEKNIEVNNIDKQVPTGSCISNIENGKTLITINAADNIGINNYVIENTIYTKNNITINKVLKDVNIDIYDKASNKTSISCKSVSSDSKITLSQSETKIINQDINIIISVESEFFDYIELPSGTKIYEKNYSYPVSSNGIYKFILYTSDGNIKEASIEVSNIDKEVPTGSCYGSYKDGNSTIYVNSYDSGGISKYEIDGKIYTTNNISISKEIDLLNVKIYDKAGNTKSISCTLENKNKLLTSDSSISFSYEYITSNDVMPYGLFTPSSANNNSKGTPLIIWLHGSGERNVSANTFKNSGLLKILNEWKLEKFNAYVICPHLASNGYSSSWNNETSRTRLNALISKIKKEKNILSNKITLVGHSLGGQGVLYMGNKDNFYSSFVVLSGYNPWVTYSNIKKPILGYVGNPSYGEDSTSYNFMVGDFKKTFGTDNTFVLNTSHGGLPKSAFTIDKNKDNKSDLIEWMLSQ